jgi:anthranilate synthase component I
VPSLRTVRELSLPALDRASRDADIIPVFKEVAYDTGTPIAAFRKIARGPRSFLLESVEGGERWARHSFLGPGSPLGIRVDGGEATLNEEAGERRFAVPSPLDALRSVMKPKRVARFESLPRFVGGWVGYLGFGAVRWFEPRVPQRHGSDSSFSDSEWMFVDRLVAFDNLRHTVTLMACVEPARFATTEAAFRAGRARIEALEEALRGPLPDEPEDAVPSHVRSVWGDDEFEAAVDRIRELIRAGECMQVVPSRRVVADYRGDPFSLYRRIRLHNPAPYLHYVRFGERVIAGASPEVLIRVEDGRAIVRPIAGTRPRGRTPAEDRALEAELRADPKELAEHVMLLDLGRNDVGRVSVTGSVAVEEREIIERYSHVMHLVSQVSGELRPEVDALDAIAAAFPAGTVSGAPKVRALEIIDELEPVSRGPYSGAVGYVGFDGNVDLALSIRSIALAGTELRFQAGAGIVHDSDPRRELEETSHKMRGMLIALGARDPERGAAP